MRIATTDTDRTTTIEKQQQQQCSTSTFRFPGRRRHRSGGSSDEDTNSTTTTEDGDDESSVDGSCTSGSCIGEVAKRKSVPVGTKEKPKNSNSNNLDNVVGVEDSSRAIIIPTTTTVTTTTAASTAAITTATTTTTTRHVDGVDDGGREQKERGSKELPPLPPPPPPPPPSLLLLKSALRPPRRGRGLRRSDSSTVSDVSSGGAEEEEQEQEEGTTTTTTGHTASTSATTSTNKKDAAFPPPKTRRRVKGLWNSHDDDGSSSHPFSVLHDDLVADRVLAPYLSLPDLCRVSCVSRRFRHAVHELARPRVARTRPVFDATDFVREAYRGFLRQCNNNIGDSPSSSSRPDVETSRALAAIIQRYNSSSTTAAISKSTSRTSSAPQRPVVAANSNNNAIRSLSVRSVGRRLDADTFLPKIHDGLRELTLSGFEGLTDVHVNVMLLSHPVVPDDGHHRGGGDDAPNGTAAASRRRIFRRKSVQSSALAASPAFLTSGGGGATTNPNLRVLRIEDCPLLTEKCLRSIALACPNLRELSLKGCPNVESDEPLKDCWKKMTRKATTTTTTPSVTVVAPSPAPPPQGSLQSLFSPPPPKASTPPPPAVVAPSNSATAGLASLFAPPTGTTPPRPPRPSAAGSAASGGCGGQLCKIDLSGTKVTPSGLTEALEVACRSSASGAAAGLVQLECIRMGGSGESWRDDDLLRLSSHVEMSALRTLDIGCSDVRTGSSNLTSSGLDSMSSAANAFPFLSSLLPQRTPPMKLERLSLAGHRAITAESVGKIVSASPNLSLLNLDGCERVSTCDKDSLRSMLRRPSGPRRSGSSSEYGGGGACRQARDWAAIESFRRSRVASSLRALDLSG